MKASAVFLFALVAIAAAPAQAQLDTTLLNNPVRFWPMGTRLPRAIDAGSSMIGSLSLLRC